MENEPLHFDVLDFKGNRIICTEFQWINHVVGDPNHPYMDGCEEEVAAALQDPEYGYRCYDRRDPCKRVYYKLSKSKDYWIKVVVKYEDASCSGTGRVHTAYMPGNITDGEKPEFDYE